MHYGSLLVSTALQFASNMYDYPCAVCMESLLQCSDDHITLPQQPMQGLVGFVVIILNKSLSEQYCSDQQRLLLCHANPVVEIQLSGRHIVVQMFLGFHCSHLLGVVLETSRCGGILQEILEGRGTGELLFLMK